MNNNHVNALRKIYEHDAHSKMKLCSRDKEIALHFQAEMS
jgi:hypothetical protein